MVSIFTAASQFIRHKLNITVTLRMSIIVITGFQAIYINKPNCAGAFLFPDPINVI